ncbi:hypothetical protein Golomagni_03703 [Golovinomyces magnicellulatus]|nr:hypothetical protein Golomagni_03703 [Golovinomyces magnicellulatus]
MTSLSSHHPFPHASYQPYHNSQNYPKSRTIEVTLGVDKPNRSPSFSQNEHHEFSPQIRSRILAHLASTSRPFALSIRNSDKHLHQQDILDLRELLYLSNEDRWWEINLDNVFCNECVKERLKPQCQKALSSKFPLISCVAQHLTTCLCNAAYYMNKQTPYLTECPHDTTFSKIRREIDAETRGRLSCLRVTGSFIDPTQVASAIHNILLLFPNIQCAQVRLPPASHGYILEPERIAYHLATLESSLPKGVALNFQNLLEHQDFMLKWVQVKRKWYQLIPNEVEVAQLNRIRNLSDSEEKLIGVSSDSVNWAQLNRGKRFK